VAGNRGTTPATRGNHNRKALVAASSHIVNRPQLHGHYNAAKAGAYQLTP